MKDCYKKGVPTLQEAMLILKEAEKLNPGGWVNHSMFVAQGAKLIVDQTKDLAQCVKEDKSDIYN